jgi:hypothetical protein
MDAQTLIAAAHGLLFPAAVTGMQFYGLVFLLGSFTVASLSDIKRMAAQKEFAEVWLVFTSLAFTYDFYRLSGGVSIGVFALKWSMIPAFALLSWRYFGIMLSLSEMDITAACAAMSLLTPAYIILYYLLLVSMKFLAKPLLSHFGDGLSTPFLPVVLAATLAVIAAVKAASNPLLAGILS